MNFYGRFIFPWVLDRVMLRDTHVERLRKELLANAHGRVLEIGFGTGLNLRHYPTTASIAAIDANPGMMSRAQKRVLASGRDVDLRVADAAALPWPDASFDCVVSTFTLCSIPRVEQGLGEIHRVLVPGGKFLTLEHGWSPDAGVQKWQRRLNGFNRMVGAGCNVTRNIEQLIEDASLTFAQKQNDYLIGHPRPHGYATWGVAHKGP